MRKLARTLLLLLSITVSLLLVGETYASDAQATLKAEAMQEVNAINSALHQFSQKPTPSKPANLWPILIAHFNLNDHADRPEVRHELLWYLSHKQILNQMLSNATPYIYYVYQQTQQRDMPAEFALLPMLESGYDPFAYSKAGATGLWQMMPGTASSFGLDIDWWYDGRRDTIIATQAALNYLSQLHDSLHDWILTAAAYDAGAGAVQAAQQYNQRMGRRTNFWNLPLPEETRNYVPKLLALAVIIKNAAHYGVKLPYIPNRPYFAAVNMNSQIDRAEASRLSDVSPAIIHQLNPGMRRWATNPGSVYTLLIPYDKRKIFRQNLSAIIGKEQTTWQYHEVRMGETLQSIAHIYHTQASLLKKVNGLTNNQVTPDQGLLVPLNLHRTYSSAISKIPEMGPTLAKIQGEENLKQFLNKIYNRSS